MLVWVVAHALYAALFALVCLECGGRAAAFTQPRQSRGSAAALQTTFAIGLGYGILGQIFFALAAFGVLTRGSVIGVAGAALLAALLRIRDVRMPPPLILLGALPPFLLALYPPVGWDATAYHLPYARLFADAGALVFADTLRFPVFPQLAEMHFAASLLVADDVTAQLTQWLTLVVTAAATSMIATELGGERARPLAVALWLGTPLAIYVGANGYIDAALTMSVTLALAAWLIWRRTGQAGWIALAGAFAGMAAATKYHGLLFLLLLFAGVAAGVVRASGAPSEARRRRAPLLFALPAALFAAPWYARIAYETGNPVFPFFARVFGRNAWGAFFERNPAEYIGLPNDPLLGVARRAIIERVALGMAPHSPWLLLLLPLAVAAAVLQPRLRVPLAISAVWAIVMSPLDWRFMLPVVPLLCVAIALVLERLLPARAIPFAAAALVLPGFVWGSLLVAKFGAIPDTAAERDTFVATKIPVYRALQFAGTSPAYVVHAANAAYYCRGRCLGELLGPYRYEHVEPLLRDPPRLAATLRRFGARYLIVEKSRRLSLPFRRVYADEVAEVFEVP